MAWPVEVLTEPSITVSYLRRIQDETLRDPPDCPFREKSSFKAQHIFEDVRFPTEKLTLQLGAETPDEKAPGLNIGAIKLRKSPQNGEYSFSRDGVVGLLSLQRARGDSSPPTLSSTAIDIDTAKLEKIPLKRLTIKVN